jgi:hypothetical protein
MRRRTAAILGAVTFFVGAAFLFFRQGSPTPAEPTQASSAPIAPPSSASAPAAIASAASAAPSASATRAPLFLPKDEQRRLFLAEMAETRKTLLSKYRYPPGSQSLAERTDMLMPHHVEPVLRGLSATGDGKLSVEQNQSRIYLRPDQTAVASIKILYAGKPTPVDFSSTDLNREAVGSGPDTKVGSVNFHDDGVAPDEIASDGVWTANVSMPSGNPPSGMKLLVKLSSNGESGQLFFPFIQTGPSPAEFTQNVRVAFEDGSVAFYVGVNVTNPGPFEILGRVYDSAGTPVALCRFHDNLAAGTQEVRFVAYGKLLLDEGAIPPLTLQDLEGWRFSLGQYPDRDVMDEWAGGVTTPAYDVSLFTGQDWNGGDMQSQLQALDQSTADGLANLQSQPGP